MQCFSLEIMRADDGNHQWRIWHKCVPTEDRFRPYIRSLPIYPVFKDALDAGAVMLARACGEPYVNVAGNSDSDALDAHIDRGDADASACVIGHSPRPTA